MEIRQTVWYLPSKSIKREEISGKPQDLKKINLDEE